MLAYGGTAVTVGAAVVCSLAVSSAVALTDVAAVPVSATPVVVPAGPNPGAAQDPTTVDERAEKRAGHPVVQTVPAPQPKTVKKKSAAPQQSVQADAAEAAPKAKPGAKRDKVDAKRDKADAKRSKDAAQERKKPWWGDGDKPWRGGDHDDKASAKAKKMSAQADTRSGHDLPREWTGSERKKPRSSSPADRD